jgi:excinuclease ABC subunit C
MNQCSGSCQAGRTQAEYHSVIDHVKQLLSGNYKEVSNHFRASMLEAADNLNFELAAEFRDKLNAIEALGNKQLLTAGSLADTDVIGYAETHTNGCFTVLHFSGDNLLDKEYEIFPRPDSREAAVSSLMKQYYLSRGYSPKRVLLPFDIDDSDLFADLLAQQHGRRPKLKVPQRGDSFLLVELANKNAQEEVDRITTKEEKTHGTLILLGKMLNIATPHRIEAFDISNTAGTDIVASMVVFQDGRPHKSSYKRFKIEGFENQDDYRAMYQVITRRFTHYKSGDESFCLSPDLLLIDGGIEHASVATEALRCLGLDFPVVGMVKDNRHRTRALVTPDGKEVAITNQQAIFSLIGTIQEEAHRFAISFHKELRSKRLRSSQLDQIKGVGPKRKQDLLRVFKSLSAISSASLLDLEQVLPRDVAQSVYEFYHNQEH